MARASGRPQVVLRDEERHFVVMQLDEILRRLDAVEEHLTVAAWRSQTNVSAWTEARLDAIRDGASGLRGKVEHAPLDAD